MHPYGYQVFNTTVGVPLMHVTFQSKGMGFIDDMFITTKSKGLGRNKKIYMDI